MLSSLSTGEKRGKKGGGFQRGVSPRHPLPPPHTHMHPALPPRTHSTPPNHPLPTSVLSMKQPLHPPPPHTHSCMQTHTQTHTKTDTHTDRHTHTPRIHNHTRTHTHTYARTRAHTHTHMHTHMHDRTHTHPVLSSPGRRPTEPPRPVQVPRWPRHQTTQQSLWGYSHSAAAQTRKRWRCLQGGGVGGGAWAHSLPGIGCRRHQGWGRG